MSFSNFWFVFKLIAQFHFSTLLDYTYNVLLVWMYNSKCFWFRFMNIYNFKLISWVWNYCHCASFCAQKDCEFLNLNVYNIQLILSFVYGNGNYLKRIWLKSSDQEVILRNKRRNVGQASPKKLFSENSFLSRALLTRGDDCKGSIVNINAADSGREKYLNNNYQTTLGSCYALG